jgi:hypothetical protein
MTFDHRESITDTWESHASDVVRDPTARRIPALSGRSLAVLADLGLSDAQIALYFRVAPDRVVSLRRYYGLTAPGYSKSA